MHEPKTSGNKICNVCKRNLPVIMFSTDKSMKDGIKNRCRDCDKPYRKMTYKKKRL